MNKTSLAANDSAATFEPSSWLLEQMIQSAMARFDCAVDQASRRVEAQAEARAAKVFDAEVKARYYRRIQLGA